MKADGCGLLDGYGTGVSRFMIVSSCTSARSSSLMIMLIDVAVATGSDSTSASFIIHVCVELFQQQIARSPYISYLYHCSFFVVLFQTVAVCQL